VPNHYAILSHQLACPQMAAKSGAAPNRIVLKRVVRKSGQRQTPKTPPGSRQVRVIIVDDHQFMRDLIARTLSGQFAVVAAVGTAREAISACDRLKPDVLILDVNLPDGSGIEAVPDIKRLSPTTRVLLCTAYPQEQPMAELVKAGAQGYVEKTSTWQNFVVAVDRVSKGELYFCSQPNAATSPRVGRNHGSRGPAKIACLTSRENEVVSLLAAGLTSKEIAARLNISVATVDTHRTNAMQKLGVHNVAGLVSRAFRSGMMNVPMEPQA
jgi:DNA-binding NarL/FixJ family response regulator